MSYADPSEGHHGGIYQGGGWTYVGRSSESTQYLQDGRWKHSREIRYGAFGQGKRTLLAGKPAWYGLPSRNVPGKHTYLMPLDDAMRANIAHLSKPYPKKIPRAGSADSSTSAPQAEGDGANPIPALQLAATHDRPEAQGETRAQDEADA